MTPLNRFPAIRTSNQDAWFENVVARNPGARPLRPGPGHSRGPFAVNHLALNSVSVVAGRCAPYGLGIAEDERVRIHLPRRGKTQLRHKGREVTMPETVAAVVLPRGDFETLFPDGIASAMLSTSRRQMAEVLDELGCRTPVEHLIDRVAADDSVPGLAGVRSGVAQLFAVFEDETQAVLDLPRLKTAMEDLLLVRMASALAGSGDRAGADAVDAPVLRRCIAYLRHMAGGPVSMRAMAREAGTSLRHAQALFRRELDTTPGAYLRKVRLEAAHARLMAAGPDDSVTTVALDCGFSHLGEFASHYRDHYGESPSATLRRAGTGS